MRVPMTGLVAQHGPLEGEILPRVLEVVRAQSFILGEPVQAFERTLARIFKTPYAVGVASGTDALALSLWALGIGPGDLVVVPAFGFVASAEAVVRVGARPLFADVTGFLLAREGVESALHRLAKGSRERVRAILPVHLFGQCAPMGELETLAKTEGLSVVEDAAQAILAEDRGRLAGSVGSLGAVSFFPTKNLGGWGDGGAVVTSDLELANRVRRLRQHGIEGGRSLEVGTNSRLDGVQAVVLDAKAPHLEDWTRARERIADIYRRELRSLSEQVRSPEPPSPGSRHVYNQFVVRVTHPEALGAHLAEREIETRRYYARPLSAEPAYATFAAGVPFAGAEAAASTSLALPIYPELREDQQAHVIESIRAFYRVQPQAR
jgi:dTDP-4-amino-4,6-dideoxygalactose transaminase